MTDLHTSQGYFPAPYPRMLYATATQYLVVNNEAEEVDARARGYTDFGQIDVAADGLDNLAKEALIALALGLIRTNLAKTPAEDIIDGIRQMRARAADEAAATADGAPEALTAEEIENHVEIENSAAPEEIEPTPDLDAMSDDELRAHLSARDGKPPHHKLRREKLLQRAREPAAPQPEPDAT